MPGIPVIAEEEVAAGRMPETLDDFILVDPLDGTKEFLSRNGEFTVNIALVRGGVPVLGVVYAPALGKIYAGGPDGAYAGTVANHRMESSRRIEVRAAGSPIMAIGSRSHGSAETEAWLKRYGDVSFVAAGSSLKFCLVAEGAADIYPRLGRTMEWDTAAGDAVLRAAGGLVTTLDGAHLSYGKRVQETDSAYANPFFIAFGDRRLVRAVGEPESRLVPA
jgi:3'(2'),5'-bisphosphate nucleotidase